MSLADTIEISEDARVFANAKSASPVMGKSDIVQAISKAIGEIGKLGKEHKNKHAGYNFCSIDDFLAATGPVCSSNGLAVITDEVSVEPVTNNGKTWLRFLFDFTVMHSSGQCLGPYRRTIEIQHMGAQSFGGAQSYALKQFLRSLLQIPTGDHDDPDYQPPKEITPAEKAAKKAEPVLIDEKGISFLRQSVRNCDAFFDFDQFADWLRQLRGIEVDQLTADMAFKIGQFLDKNTPADEWSEEYQAAWKKVLGKDQGGE